MAKADCACTVLMPAVILTFLGVLIAYFTKGCGACSNGAACSGCARCHTKLLSVAPGGQIAFLYPGCH